MSDSSSFSLLHETVRRWIWNKGWESLRDIQERSIPHIINEGGDLIISAATASGKTEAAFLPIVSRMAEGGNERGGFRAVYISPLKALINDQFRRIENLCEEANIPVTKWHGDVPASAKTRAKRSPGGILLITPESMEAMLCLRGNDMPRLFGGLEHIVVDELHAFMGNERGCQLRSVMHRVETITGRTCRIGLSATLADMTTACAALRPDNPEGVTVLVSEDNPNGIALSVRGYEMKNSDDIPADMYRVLHGSKNLVFAGSRRNVETLTVALNAIGESPEPEFFAHHGSLSREFREEAERRMRSPQPASIVCTTTLELGIDVGDVESTAQYGPGFSVSGMRQRMGRSGRREGLPSILRTYIREVRMAHDTHPVDALRMETFRTAAMTELMLERWNEPPVASRTDLSTVLQQILALITQRGGISPARTFGMLSTSGVFPNLSMDLYKRLLTAMREKELIEQAPDGLMLLGAAGEGLVRSHEFYAVFMTPEEYRVAEAGGKTIGTIPASGAVAAGTLILLGGRRWSVTGADPDRKLITVERAYGGTPPVFGGGMPSPHARVVERMRAIYMNHTVPEYMDRVSARFMEEGRDTFRTLGLDRSSVVRREGETLLFPWTGGRELTALRLALLNRGLRVEEDTVALLVEDEEPGKLERALNRLASGNIPPDTELAGMVEDMLRAKYDEYLTTELLREDWAAEYISSANLRETAIRLGGIQEAQQEEAA